MIIHLDLSQELHREAVNEYTTALGRIQHFSDAIVKAVNEGELEDLEYLSSRMDFWTRKRDSNRVLLKMYSTEMSNAPSN